jgi:hypothetical protein
MKPFTVKCFSRFLLYIKPEKTGNCSAWKLWLTFPVCQAGAVGVFLMRHRYITFLAKAGRKWELFGYFYTSATILTYRISIN